MRVLLWGLRFTRRVGASARDWSMRVGGTGVVLVSSCGLMLGCCLGCRSIGDIRSGVVCIMRATAFGMTWQLTHRLLGTCKIVVVLAPIDFCDIFVYTNRIPIGLFGSLYYFLLLIKPVPFWQGIANGLLTGYFYLVKNIWFGACWHLMALLEDL